VIKLIGAKVYHRCNSYNEQLTPDWRWHVCEKKRRGARTSWILRGRQFVGYNLSEISSGMDVRVIV